MSLHHRAIDALTPGQKLFDKGVTPGLHLLVLPSGSKVWRLKYSVQGKERLASLGAWPDVGIDEARARAVAARVLISKGVSPTEEQQKEKDAAAEASRQTFGLACDDWLTWLRSTGKSQKTVAKAEWIARLFKPLFARPIAELTTPELYAIIKRHEDLGRRETAHRMKSTCVRIFDRAAVSGWVKHGVNPASLIGRQLLPVRSKNHAGVTDPRQLGALLKIIDTSAYAGVTVRNALRLLPHVFVRPGELRLMRWAELRDLNSAEPLWVVPAGTMKMRRVHTVPLSTQAANIIREQSIISDNSEFVFPGGRSTRRPLSDGALNAALESLFVTSAEHTPHGFRTTASTMLRELKFESELVEKQLAHRTGTTVSGIYDKSERLPERRVMMQRWSDYLDELKAKR